MGIYNLTEARHGRLLYNTNDNYIGRSLAHYGEWSEAEIWLFGQIVRAGDTVLEAGANIGSHTVWFSRAVRDGCVLAFEPARHTHQLLCANLALNECLNVHAYQQVVGSTDGTVEFPLLDPHEPCNFGAASMLRTSGLALEKVTQIALDSLVLERLDFVKADIEGFELEMLYGSSKTFATHRPVLYLEITPVLGERGGNRNALVEFLLPLNYSAYYFIAPMFNPNNFKGELTNIFNAHSFDLICVPNEKVEISGLTLAEIDDQRLTFGANDSAEFLALPWNGARVHYR